MITYKTLFIFTLLFVVLGCGAGSDIAPPPVPAPPNVDVPADGKRDDTDKPIVTNFEECAAVVGQVALSYPAQCFYDGQTFVQEIEEDIVGPDVQPSNFSECIDAGGQLVEGIPPTCYWGDEQFGPSIVDPNENL